MAKRSRHISHLLMIVGGTFAFLLIAASILVPEPKPFPAPIPENSKNSPAEQNGQVEGASTSDAAPAAALVDTSNWKTYSDPVYHFILKYPEEWETPTAKKVSDPDFDYEYQVSFGTKNTLSGENFDGFNLYVFQTNKCGAAANPTNGSDGSAAGDAAPRCSTSKANVSTGTATPEKILEFSSIAYTYTIVPFIPPENADVDLVKKVSVELDESGKTFQYDTTLKIPDPPKVVAKPAPASVTAPKPKPAPAVGRRGKLTGAVASGGKLVCPHPNRKPRRSPNKGNHVDEDCCPDPDEYPNAACAYKPSDYKIML